MQEYKNNFSPIFMGHQARVQALFFQNGLGWSHFLLHILVLNKKFFPWSCLVLFCSTIFSTQGENSRAVLNFGNWKTKILIPEFLFHFFIGIEPGREAISLEWAGIRRDGKWLVLSARGEKFPQFFRKIWFPGKAFGNTDLYLNI